MVDPDSSELSDDELARAEVVDLYTFGRHIELHDLNRTRRTSSPNALPGLDVQPTPRQGDFVVRAQTLQRAASRLLGVAEKEITDLGDPAEKERFEARVELLGWVQFILIHDAGLSTVRASVIQAAFIFKVIGYKSYWQEITPEFCANDACNRLAQLANNHLAVVTQWVFDSLSPFCNAGFYTPLRANHANWVRRDRERVDVVCRNIIRATEADLEGMMLDGDSDVACAICLEDFEDHETALSKLPVQNRRCQGHKHWANQACLVRFARTLHGVNMVAPNPRCPVCRTEFRDPEKSDNTDMLEAEPPS
jgi:hypothetical protein